MRFSLAAVAALASVVAAQTPGFAPISKPSEGEEVAAGSTYEIKWGVNSSYPGTVTVALLGGDSPGLLFPEEILAKKVQNSLGSFKWVVDKDLGDEVTYGIQITYEEDTTIFQLGFPFKIVGGSVDDDDDDDTTSAPPKTSTAVTSAPSSMPSGSFSGNLSTTAGPSRTTIQSTTTTSAPTRSTGTNAPTGAAAALSGSNVALFGGLAMALFAL